MGLPTTPSINPDDRLLEQALDVPAHHALSSGLRVRRSVDITDSAGVRVGNAHYFGQDGAPIARFQVGVSGDAGSREAVMLLIEVEPPYRQQKFASALQIQAWGVFERAGLLAARANCTNDGRKAWINDYDWDLQPYEGLSNAGAVWNALAQRLPTTCSDPQAVLGDIRSLMESASPGGHHDWVLSIGDVDPDSDVARVRSLLLACSPAELTRIAAKHGASDREPLAGGQAWYGVRYLPAGQALRTRERARVPASDATP